MIISEPLAGIMIVLSVIGAITVMVVWVMSWVEAFRYWRNKR